MLDGLVLKMRTGAARRFFALGLALCVGAGLFASHGLAQTADPAAAAPEAPANPQPWTISCAGQGAEGKLACSMTQRLVAKTSGQRVLSISIVRASSGYNATLSLPHGLLLPEGVQTWIDEGERTKYPITTADQNGSYASVPMSNALIASMKKGTILNVLVKSVSGDEVIFQLSLNGFTAALDKV